MTSLLLSLALALYLLTTATFVAQVMTGHVTLRRVAHGLLGAAFALHAASLVVRAVSVGIDVVGSLQDELSVIACFMVGAYLVLAWRTNVTVVGALITPLAFLFSLSAHAFGAAPPELPRELQSFWLPAHVAPALLGYAVFTVAFCLSLIYLLQERQLKAKATGDLFRRLPSLEALDDLNHRFVTWGFALFTVGLITGSLLAKQTWGALWSWEPVQVLSAITWLLYGLLLQARTAGWRGRKAARFTILGFVLLVVTFLSMNLAFSGKHGSGAFG